MKTRIKTVKLPGLHPAQRQIVAEAQRNNVLCCGRRFGKTTLAHNLVVEAVAKGLPVGWFSPSYKSLSESWATLNHLLDPIIADRSAQEHTLEFSTDGKLDMWSLDQSGAAARGRAYALAVVDEAAQVVGLEEAWQNVIRPMLVDYRGDCWFLSTPSGSQHYFYKLFLRGMDPDQRGVRMSWQYPTAANPHIAPEDIEAARADMSEVAFLQEHMGQFVAWEGAVFRNLLACVLPEPIPKEKLGWQQTHWHDVRRKAWVIGVDWAGAKGTGDYTAFVAAGVHDGVVYEVDRFRGLDYNAQVLRLQNLMWRWRPVMILAAENMIGAVLLHNINRDLQAAGSSVLVTPFQTQNRSKEAIIQALQLGFEREEIRIPNDPVLVGELQSFEASVLPQSGLTRYSARQGGNDDTVIALALAWEARRRSGGLCLTGAEMQQQREAGRALWGLLMSGGGV